MKNIFIKIAFSLFLFQFSIITIGQTDANIPYKGITIYIDYPDVPATIGSVQLDSLINGITYQEPTVQRTFRKYWHEQSKRNVDIQHDIFFFTAPLSASHYNSVPWYEGIELWRDAFEWVISNHPSYDWNTLSLDQDGGLLSAMIISSSFDPAGVGGGHGPNWTLSNGVNIKRTYGSVLQAPWDTDLNLFMTLHEAGHGIYRLPDTYDTQYNSGGTSFYCLMSGGQPEIEPLGGPFLVQNNWGYTVEPSVGTHTITLKADGDSVVVFRNPHDPFEFFTIEARKQSTLGNALFPADLGLLLWHSDNKVNTSNTLENMTPSSHYLHSIEQADGLFELENDINIGGNIGDIYLPGTSFSSTSTPNSNWWTGEESHFEINDIQFIGTDHIQFTVTIPEIHQDHYPEISQSNWSVVSETLAQAGFDATKAFDNDIDTYYHVPFWTDSGLRPYDVVLDLGDEYTINEFYYTANKNYTPPWEGRIRDYELYISNDTTNWGTAINAGTFFQTKIRQYILFPETNGRYVKFSAINSFINDDSRTSIAEINIRGVLTSTTNISTHNFEEEYKIFPNPANDILNIETPDIENITLEIYNTYGQLTLSKTISGSSNSIDLQSFVKGIYFVQITGADSKHVVKLLKQ